MLLAWNLVERCLDLMVQKYFPKWWSFFNDVIRKLKKSCVNEKKP